jgi:phosphoribosyl 1,2-cyclic phosphodiesterase
MRSRLYFPEADPGGRGELVARLGEVVVEGTSVGALATAFAINEWRVAVDMGRCSTLLAAQDTVLLTHCHSDHVAGLVAWLSAHTRRHRDRPTRIRVPAPRRDQLLRALEVWPDLDGVRRRVDLEQTVVAASPGDTVELAGGGLARAFGVHHSVPSLGWTLGTRRHPRPAVVFAGDGTVQPFKDDPLLLDGAAAVVDCSFIDPGTRVAARLGGHGHLQDWLELLPALPCDVLVLAHLPASTDGLQILDRIGTLTGAGPLVLPWISPPHNPPPVPGPAVQER